jgi:hypothetical protein
MDHSEKLMEPIDKKKFRMENGRIYFSRATERRFFFSLTVVMLLVGLLFKLGVLQ